MANVQLQRPATITTTAIQQKQSLEVVQTILHGGLSNILFIRYSLLLSVLNPIGEVTNIISGFFPEKAYLERFYGAEDAIPSYDDFSSGRLPDTNALGGTRIQLLHRGRCRRADNFLDWLESDAFPALKSGELQCLQVLVHADAGARDQIVESYTFTVKYDTNARLQRVASGVEVQSPDSRAVTVGATSKALQAVLKQVKSFHDTLPNLPGRQFVSMRMTYRADGRVPKGWIPAPSDKPLLGQAEGWMEEQETIGPISSNFHKTAFEISHLQHHRRRVHAGQEPLTIPDQLQYVREVAALPGQEVAEAIDHATSQPAQLPSEDVSAALAKSYHVNEPTETIPTQSLGRDTSRNHVSGGSFRRASIPSRRSARSSRQNQTGDTQTSNATEMREAFRSFMQPEQNTQGDTQTQAPFFPAFPASESTATPSRGEQSPAIKGYNAVSERDTKLALSQTAVERLQQVRKQKRRRSGHRSKGSRNTRKEPDVVTCECGGAEEEGCMIFCSACDTWQHAYCYGFTGQDDPRIPDDHVCYDCLLGQAEPQTLRTLHGLMQKRRVMQLTEQEGPKKLSEISASLKLSPSDAEGIVDNLREEGYVVAAKKVKKGSSSAVAYSAVQSGRVHNKMLHDLFDPLLLISHHYQIPGAIEPRLPSKRALNGFAGEMPPPLTPASRLVKHAQTPGSGLDLRRSMTPYKTPDMPQSRLRSGTKRRRKDSVERKNDQMQARSVQTQIVLDTSALSSSPA